MLIGRESVRNSPTRKNTVASSVRDEAVDVEAIYSFRREFMVVRILASSILTTRGCFSYMWREFYRYHMTQVRKHACKQKGKFLLVNELRKLKRNSSCSVHLMMK
jgi:hypothetical protein